MFLLFFSDLQPKESEETKRPEECVTVTAMPTHLPKALDKTI